MSQIVSPYEEYHPILDNLSWLFGVWESVEAEVFYPTMETIKYKDVLEFVPTMKPIIEYKSETWHAEKGTKLHCERGFLRVDPETLKIALMVSHNFGLTEVSEGFISEDKNVLSLTSTSISRMSFSKHAVTVQIARNYSLVNSELHQLVKLQTTTQPLQDHLKSRYVKKN